MCVSYVISQNIKQRQKCENRIVGRDSNTNENKCAFAFDE